MKTFQQFMCEMPTPGKVIRRNPDGSMVQMTTNPDGSRGPDLYLDPVGDGTKGTRRVVPPGKLF